ncbi:MAG: hypothetical protein HYS27_08510 [Deltaproteobacteria bacterium]|nr:hypothetical protein [Deltaproteobacteria bacterium]
MIDVDMLLVLVGVVGALAFLAWRFAPGRAPPPCHPARPSAGGDDQVVIGAALARGLRAAERRRPRRRQQ